MPSKPRTPAEYLAAVDAERKAAVEKLHRTIKKSLRGGFVDTIAYGMIGYVVPHELYAAGYHTDPEQPLPFMSLAAQKRYIAVYHMGLYDEALLAWLRDAWKQESDSKLDMGKSCIRLKKLDAIPYALIGELAAKMTAAEWVAYYEAHVKR